MIKHGEKDDGVPQPEAIIVDESAVAHSAPESKTMYLVPGSIIIAGVLIAGSIFYVLGPQRNGGGAVPVQPAAPGNAAQGNPSAGVGKLSPRDVVLGSQSAPVTLIEYGDYQCPFCGQFFTQVQPPLQKNYIDTGKVKMIFRNFPFLGKESNDSAEAAECAKDQNKFWPYHDALYAAEVADGRENNGNLNRSLFLKLAGTLNMDVAVFTGCIDGHKYLSQVASDRTAAPAFGVNSTPTTFVNGEQLVGALPYDQFASAIDAALKGK